MDDVPHGELPEVLEEGLDASAQAGLLFVPPAVPVNHGLFYRPMKAKFSLLITVGRMEEACEVQQTIIDSMVKCNYEPAYIGWETQNYSEILYDFGRVEEAEVQLKIALEKLAANGKFPREVMNLKNDYIHKFLFPSGRTEEAQSKWNDLRGNFLCLVSFCFNSDCFAR